MRITEHVYLVGSGHLGFDLTDPYDCNVYLIDGGTELALIDGGSGMGVPLIQAQITAHGFSLEEVKSLILTHSHGDHGGGAWVWKEAMPHLEVLGTSETRDALTYEGDGGEIMAAAKRHGYYPADYLLHPCKVDKVVRTGDVISVGSVDFKVIQTPGHCDSLMCLVTYLDGKKMLFCGDMVFCGGRISTQAVPDCRPYEYYRSLKRIAQESVDALFPGHYEFSLRDANRHLLAALEYFDRLAIAPSNVT